MIIGMGFESIVQDADIATPLQRSDVFFEELPVVLSLALGEKELSFWVQFLYSVFHGCCSSSTSSLLTDDKPPGPTLRCYNAPRISNFEFRIFNGRLSTLFKSRDPNGLSGLGLGLGIHKGIFESN